MSSTVAIIQARMNSTRLPGKVLKKLEGKSVIEIIVTRLKTCNRIQKIVLATSTSSLDDAVAAEGVRLGILVVRGSEENVLSRFYDAATKEKAGTIVRLTGDNPLVDPILVEDMLEAFESMQRKQAVDYMSNALERTFPRGFETEIFTMQALETAYREAQKTSEKEHVTPYLYLNPDKFKIFPYKQLSDDSAVRLTLDTPEDWELLQRVLPELVRTYGWNFTFQDAVSVMEKHPEWTALNAHVQQKPL